MEAPRASGNCSKSRTAALKCTHQRVSLIIFECHGMAVFVLRFEFMVETLSFQGEPGPHANFSLSVDISTLLVTFNCWGVSPCFLCFLLCFFCFSCGLPCRSPFSFPSPLFPKVVLVFYFLQYCKGDTLLVFGRLRVCEPGRS